MNIKNKTNPNSIYIKIQIKIKEHKPYYIHVYVDTGASMCLASKHILPSHYWKKYDKGLKVRIGNGLINPLKIQNLLVVPQIWYQSRLLIKENNYGIRI